MNVILFGATGMVGQGALRECLRDPEVARVLTIGRRPTGQAHPKLRELTAPDLFDLSGLASELRGYDACFFCLGVSAGGMSEADYTRLTYDLTLSAAKALLQANPQMVFEYVSGAGTDSSEQGRSRWARVKGRTENALRALPFRAVYLLRPGLIQPLHGIRSQTRAYRIFYSLGGFLLPLVRAIAPSSITSTERLGKLMIRLARSGRPGAILEMKEITALEP